MFTIIVLLISHEHSIVKADGNVISFAGEDGATDILEALPPVEQICPSMTDPLSIKRSVWILQF